MRYDLFRLIMLQRDQPDLWARDLHEAPDGMPARERWLRQIFGERIAFRHYRSEYHFVPESAPAEAASALIAGRIGRPRHITENLPPEEGFIEIERDAWKTAAIIIDVNAHRDGQKSAMEVNALVGNTDPILKSLASHINNRAPSEPFVIEINPIADAETFWAFEEQNRGEIISITFELIAPNMFGTRDDLDKELKELRDHEKMQKAKLQLENEDGLKLSTDRVRNAVGYTAEGGGALRARTKRGKTFNSRRKGKRINAGATARRCAAVRCYCRGGST
jgi:hypothetical protein